MKLTVEIDDDSLSELIAKDLEGFIEDFTSNSGGIFSLETEENDRAVKHLVECMKYVHDWYSVVDKQYYPKWHENTSNTRLSS